MQKTRKSEGVCEQTINDGLLDLAFDDYEEEKKSDGLEEINARMKALSVRTPQVDQQAMSEGSWVLLDDDENSARPKDA